MLKPEELKESQVGQITYYIISNTKSMLGTCASSQEEHSAFYYVIDLITYKRTDLPHSNLHLVLELNCGKRWLLPKFTL